MNIEIIDRIETLEAVKAEWENIYRQDPQAQYFISWNWIYITIKDLDKSKVPWKILVAKTEEAGKYVGFFPLLVGIDENEGGGFYNLLSLLGATDAEHPAFLCMPEAETEILKCFARHLQEESPWSVLEMCNVPLASRRVSLFIGNFDRENFTSKKQDRDYYRNPLDEIDNQIIPYIQLPDSWELYLKTAVSSNTRQKIKRFLRKVENSSEFRITDVNAENLERHIAILTELWRKNWESRKGKKNCDRIIRNTIFELRHCFEHGCLHLPVLWQHDRPLAAIANFVDWEKKTVMFSVGSREETFKKLPSGFVLHAYAIRDAIQQGFKIYDFLIGNEAYKYSFGATERQIETVTISRRGWKEQPRKLDVNTLSIVLEVARHYHRTNDLVKAEGGYRQILAAQPQHPTALYELSAIAQRQGKKREAEELLKRLLEVQPDHLKAWFSLGTLHQTEARLGEAERAYRQALSYQPAPAIASAIYHNLGYALQQQDKLHEAIACYQQARELQPQSLEAEVSWANALALLGKLPSEQCIHYAAANCNLGNKRRQANDTTTAIAYYQQAIKLDPNLLEAHYFLGVMLRQDPNSWERAISCWQTALKLQPDFILADIAIANVRHVRGELSSAQQSKYAILNLNAANQYLQGEDLKTAVSYYRQAIALDSRLAEAHYGLGLALLKQSKNNSEESIACYQKALEILPDFDLAKVGLANALYAEDKLNEPQKIEYAKASCNLGDRYFEAGDFKVASEYYELAISLDPNLTEARHNLRQAIEQKEQRTIKVSCAR